MLPSFTDTIVAWWAVIVSGELLLRIKASMEVLFIGYSAGVITGRLAHIVGRSEPVWR